MSVTIIAEAGLNWECYADTLELADKAKECGADIIKYQTCFNWKYPMITRTDWRILKEYCDKIGIIFMSTAWSFEAIDFLAEIGMTHWKIPSSEAMNIDYVKKIYSKPYKYIYISDGFSERRNLLINYGENKIDLKFDDFKLMYCISKYPTQLNELSFKQFIKGFGYSDHTDNIYAPIIAVSHGAEVIEKHFCLSHPCIDDAVSITPDKFKEMVDVIRKLENYKEPVIPPEILALKNRVRE